MTHNAPTTPTAATDIWNAVQWYRRRDGTYSVLLASNPDGEPARGTLASGHWSRATRE